MHTKTLEPIRDDIEQKTILPYAHIASRVHFLLDTKKYNFFFTNADEIIEQGNKTFPLFGFP